MRITSSRAARLAITLDCGRFQVHTLYEMDKLAPQARYGSRRVKKKKVSVTGFIDISRRRAVTGAHHCHLSIISCQCPALVYPVAGRGRGNARSCNRSEPIFRVWVSIVAAQRSGLFRAEYAYERCNTDSPLDPAYRHLEKHTTAYPGRLFDTTVKQLEVIGDYLSLSHGAGYRCRNVRSMSLVRFTTMRARRRPLRAIVCSII